MSNATQTRNTLKIALAQANANYCARNPLMSGSDDIANAQAKLDRMSDETLNAGVSYLDLDRVVEGITRNKNVKKSLRIIDLIAFLASTDLQDLKGSCKTFALEIVGLIAGATTHDALRFASTGKGNENTSDEIAHPEITRKFRNLMGAIGSTTQPTQHGVSFSDSGLAFMTNATKPTEKGFITLNRSKSVNRIVKALSEKSEYDLSQHFGKKSK